MNDCFVWINNDYRVNISSIFSLQRIESTDNEQLNNWSKKYNEFISVPENFIELEVDNGVYWSPINGAKMPDEYVEIYAEKFNDYVESQIGPRPQNTYKYVIITNTGVKVNISKNKFDEINKIIDEKTKDKN